MQDIQKNEIHVFISTSDILQIDIKMKIYRNFPLFEQNYRVKIKLQLFRSAYCMNSQKYIKTILMKLPFHNNYQNRHKLN